MQFLAIERDLGSEFTVELLREEAAHVWSLMQQGVIRDIWFTRDRRAVLILECTGEPELARELASLPLVRERLITFDVETLLRYDGFDRLSPKPPAPSR